jgi:uncharacterized membrane protein YkoI
VEKEIITKNKNLLIIAVLVLTASSMIGILQVASAQSQSSTGAITLRNLTGSVQIFPSKSQIIQTKASVSLSAAATTAEKSVGPNSHATSAHIAIVNGYLVYRVHVIDTNNNIHRVIVDAGNGKVLSTIQFPLGHGSFHVM